MAGEKRSQDQDEISFARTVLVDIEGTTTSISFVKVKGHKGDKGSEARLRLDEIRRPCRIVSYRSIPGSGLIADLAEIYSASSAGISPSITLAAPFLPPFSPPWKIVRVPARSLSPRSRRAYIRGRIPRRVIVLASGRCTGSNREFSADREPPPAATTTAVFCKTESRLWAKDIGSSFRPKGESAAP